jgi:prevent-host-death family protein
MVAQVTTGDYLALMKAIGVKELKARLSEYLRAVKAGETLLVTERSEIVAELRPAGSRPGRPESLGDALDSLADRGELTRARVTKTSWQWKPVGLGLSARAVRDILNDVRAERDE